MHDYDGGIRYIKALRFDMLKNQYIVAKELDMLLDDYEMLEKGIGSDEDKRKAEIYFGEPFEKLMTYVMRTKPDENITPRVKRNAMLSQNMGVS